MCPIILYLYISFFHGYAIAFLTDSYNCVFASSAVSLLLDQGFKSKQSCYFHPLTNDVTIGMVDTIITSVTNTVSSHHV